MVCHDAGMPNNTDSPSAFTRTGFTDDQHRTADITRTRILTPDEHQAEMTAKILRYAVLMEEITDLHAEIVGHMEALGRNPAGN